MRRHGVGEVSAFQGFAEVPGKRRKVLTSDWRGQGPAADGLDPHITVCISGSLPMRLRCSHTFEHRGRLHCIYLDLLYVSKHYELVRFVNGPLCNRRYTLLSKATHELASQTQCKELTWQRWDGESWLPLKRQRYVNRISREQAAVAQTGQRIAAVEQCLALRPSPHQVCALPFTADGHYRNLARRLVLRGETLETLGFAESGSKSRRFLNAFQQEAWALAVQHNGTCFLCALRPVAHAYDCGHAIACLGCGQWKRCVLC